LYWAFAAAAALQQGRGEKLRKWQSENTLEKALHSLVKPLVKSFMQLQIVMTTSCCHEANA
jgi:hypothetical protein